MTTNREIEVCSNNEWLYVYGPLSDLGTESVHLDDACDEWFGDVCRAIDDEFGFGVAVAARDQRCLCHGWNGCNTWSRSGSGVGTFCEFSDAEWEKAEAIVCECADKIVSRYTAMEITDDIERLAEMVSAEDHGGAVKAWERLVGYHGVAASDPRIAKYAAAIESIRYAG